MRDLAKLPTVKVIKRTPHFFSNTLDIIVIQCTICGGQHFHCCMKSERRDLGFKMAGCSDERIIGGYDITEDVTDEENDLEKLF